MNKEYIGVLIKPKKYLELKYWEDYNIKPLKQENQVSYGTIETQTIYNLPYEITNDIDEDIKMVTKEEYDEYRKRKTKRYDEFMENYEPDYMWNNFQEIIEENKRLMEQFEILGDKE